MEPDGELPDRSELVMRAQQRLESATERLVATQRRLDTTLDSLGECDDPVRCRRLEEEADRHRAAIAVQQEAIYEQSEHLRHLGVEHPGDQAPR